MAGSGWNPTSMPARETQLGYVLPDLTFGAQAAQSSQESSAEANDERQGLEDRAG
jgi:hypothetical protein